MSDTEQVSTTDHGNLARQLYEQNRRGAGRPWEHANAATREKWLIRAAKHAATHVEQALEPEPKPEGTRAYAVGMVRLDPNGASSHALPLGTVVCSGLMQVEERQVHVPGQPNNVAVPCLICHHDPNVTEREPRTFAVLPAGVGFETHYETRYCATVVDPMTGRPSIIFELVGTQGYRSPEQGPTE